MTVSTSEIYSPGWWLKRLGDRLVADLGKLEEYIDLYDNKFSFHDPALAIDPKVAESRRKLAAMCKLNFAELIVDAVVERLTPTGFKTGREKDGESVDAKAWKIWTTNSMDSYADEMFSMALSASRVFVIVGPADEGEDVPYISIEDPRTMSVEFNPRRRRVVDAAVKIYRDDIDGKRKAILFLPGEIHRFESTVSEFDTIGEIQGSQWNLVETEETDFDFVPVVAFYNKRRGNMSFAEFDGQISDIHRINFLVQSRLEIATIQAFRQRAFKGLPEHDEHGNKIDYSGVFAAAPGAIWTLPETADIWESGQVDLTGILAAVQADIRDTAATSRTPLFYFDPSDSAGSAEGASLAREGLTFKCGSRIKGFTEPLEVLIYYMLRMDGDNDVNLSDISIVWADPERYTLAQRFDAAVKANTVGMPWRSVMELVLQYPPHVVAEMEAQRATDALLFGDLNGNAQATGASSPGVPGAGNDNGEGNPQPPTETVGQPGVTQGQ